MIEIFTLALFHKVTASMYKICEALLLKIFFNNVASGITNMAFPATAKAKTTSVPPAVVPIFMPPVIALAVAFSIVMLRIIALAGITKELLAAVIAF